MVIRARCFLLAAAVVFAAAFQLARGVFRTRSGGRTLR